MTTSPAGVDDPHRPGQAAGTAAPLRLVPSPVEHPTHPVLPPADQRPAGPWAPWSPCGSDCLPPAGPSAPLRTARRLVALAAMMLVALVVLPVAVLLGRRVGDAVVRAVFRGVLRAAGLRLQVVGDRRYAAPGTGVLVVANHLSWIDVLALGAVQPVRMLAKREVRSWPVVGLIAERVGSLFVDRAGLHALPGVVADIVEALRSGCAVGVFPEGTTWCGSASGPFRRAVFQAALDAGVSVRPVALELRLLDGRPTTVGAFVGETTLFDSLRRVLALDGLVCEVSVLPPLTARPGEDRRSLADRAERAVAGAVPVG